MEVIMTHDEFRKCLAGLSLDDLKVEFDPESTPPSLVAVLTSKSFEGMEDWQRQETVWAHLLQHADLDWAQVEFVFTLTPAERTALDAVPGAA